MRNSMDTNHEMKSKLATLWIFAAINYIYGDVFTAFETLSDSKAMKAMMAGYAGPIHMTSGAFLGFAILMETAFVMVPLARFLPYQANRWTNIVLGIFHTLVAIVFVFIGGWPSTFLTADAFFVLVEVICTLLIVWLAWTWKESKVAAAVGAAA